MSIKVRKRLSILPEGNIGERRRAITIRLDIPFLPCYYHQCGYRQHGNRLHIPESDTKKCQRRNVTRKMCFLLHPPYFTSCSLWQRVNATDTALCRRLLRRQAASYVSDQRRSIVRSSVC